MNYEFFDKLSEMYERIEQLKEMGVIIKYRGRSHWRPKKYTIQWTKEDQEDD